MLASWQAEPGPGVSLQGLGVPELASDCWWVGSVPDITGYRVWGVPKLTFISWWAGLGSSRSQADAGLLVVGWGLSWQASGLWLSCRGKAGPEARAGSLVGGAQVQQILGLLPAHWWAELGPRVSGCRSLGVPCLVPVHWFVGLGPRPSGGQRCVQGWF